MSKSILVADEYKKIFNNLYDAVLIETFDGDIIEANEAACKLYGYGHEELLKLPVSRLIPAVDQESVKKLLREEAETNGRVFSGENIRKDGTRFPAESRTQVAEIDGRSVLIVTIRDITNRIDRENNLKVARSQLQGILDNLPFMAWLKDKNGCILAANKPLYEAFDLHDKTIVGLTDWEIMPRLLAEQCALSDQYAIAYKKLYHKEEQSVDKTGNVIWYETFKSPVFDDQENVIGTVGMTRDITYQKHLHDELVKAKEVAEAVNESKTQFLANMSHEFYTPMNSVLGMTELTLETTTITDEQRDYLETVLSSGNRLMELIGDLLFYTQVESKNYQLQEDWFSLPELIIKVIRDQQTKAEKKGIRLSYQLEGQFPDVIVFDQNCMYRAIRHLVGNAIKFTEHGSVTVKLTTKSIEVGIVDFELSVVDTGIGISEQERGSIFQLFTQVDSSTTRRYGGAGIGLLLVHKILELMSCQLELKSEIGKGSRFSIIGKTHYMDTDLV